MLLQGVPSACALQSIEVEINASQPDELDVRIDVSHRPMTRFMSTPLGGLPISASVLLGRSICWTGLGGSLPPFFEVSFSGGLSLRPSWWWGSCSAIQPGPPSSQGGLTVPEFMAHPYPDTPCVPYMPTLGWFEGSM